MFSSSKASRAIEKRELRDDPLMLATVRYDTSNVLNIQHITPNSKRWDHSDIPGGGHIKIKGPGHVVEGGHHLRKAPPPTHLKPVSSRGTQAVKHKTDREKICVVWVTPWKNETELFSHKANVDINCQQVCGDKVLKWYSSSGGALGHNTCLATWDMGTSGVHDFSFPKGG